MSKLKAGFSRVDITPMLGIELYGYYKKRIAEGILDALTINAIAISDDDLQALLISVDNCGIIRPLIEEFQREISIATGVPVDAIYIHATHTHTGPYLVNRESEKVGSVLSNIIDTKPDDAQKQLQKEYYQFFKRKIIDASVLALKDLKNSSAFFGRGDAPGIGFIRRYKMKNGSTCTNPGHNNPDVVKPIGRPDDEICIIQFTRENDDDILIVSYGNHPDVLNGLNEFSAQWCGQTRTIIENALKNTRCVFFNGTMGDVNHIDINKECLKADEAYAHSYKMGQVIAGGVLQAIGFLAPIDNAKLRVGQVVVNVPSQMPTIADNMSIAHEINNLHNEGRDIEIQPGLMEVPRAARLVRLEHGPETFEMKLSAVALGKVAMIGIPGQLFATSGFDLKAIEGWDMIIPTAQTNGSEGYFPAKSAYSEGGYETDASNFKEGVAELLVLESEKLLKKLI